MWIMERLTFWRFLPEPKLAATERATMRNLPLLFAASVLLAACGGGGDADRNDSASPAANQGGGVAGTVGGARAIAASDSLTGLYEAKSGGLPSQLCIVERGAGATRFGLNIWGANMHACSGAGTVTRDGNRLSLTMAGDRSCTLSATIEGDAVRISDNIPEGCSYYCGQNVAMAGVRLARSGNTQADAMKARDVVDEPLCDAPGEG
jgi:hypothetical protein